MVSLKFVGRFFLLAVIYFQSITCANVSIQFYFLHVVKEKNFHSFSLFSHVLCVCVCVRVFFFLLFCTFIQCKALFVHDVRFSCELIAFSLSVSPYFSIFFSEQPSNVRIVYAMLIWDYDTKSPHIQAHIHIYIYGTYREQHTKKDSIRVIATVRVEKIGSSEARGKAEIEESLKGTKRNG